MLVLLSLAGAPVTSYAADYFWDTNGGTLTVTAPAGVVPDGSVQGGSGTWTNAAGTNNATFADSGDTTRIVYAVAGSAATNAIATNLDTITFGGTPGGGTVTIGTNTIGTSTTSGAAAQALIFATSGYTLTGSQLRLLNGATSGRITVNSGVTATINSGLQGNSVGGINANATTSGTIDSQVTINGGGTLNLGGGNGNMGFDVDGATTVIVTGGTFSGFNLNSINNGSIVRTTANNVLQGPSSFTSLTGATTGTLDLNGTTQTFSTIGGNVAVTNSTSTGTPTLSLTLTNNTLTHIGVISNGTGKLSIATVGTVAQGSGFSSTLAFATQTLAGSNTYTGFTSLGRGTVALDFSNAAAPVSNILYNTGFGTPTGDDGKLIIARPTATINGVANSGNGSFSTLILTGRANTTNSQQFNGLKLTDGAANILINPNAAANTITLNLGPTIERSAGSLINFATSNATTVLSGSASIASSAGSASGVLKDTNGVAFAVMGGRDWAAKNAANTGVVTGATAGAAGASIFTASTPSGFTANADIAIPVAGGAANDVRLSANTTISTLKYSDSGRSGINLGGSILTTGGILLSQANTSSGNYIGNGTITSPGASGSDIVLYSNTANFFGVNAVLANGAAATGFTKGGNGFVIQNANNTFTGVLTVNEGGLVVRGTNTASGVNINGSQTNITGAQLPPAGSGTAGTYLQIGNADTSGSIGSGNVSLGVNGLLGIKRSDNFSLDNNVNGSGGITQGWSGTTTMVSAASPKYTYVGDTTVTAGTLKLDFAASNTGILPDTTRLVLAGGTVEYATVAGTSTNDAVRDVVLLAGASTINKTGTGAGRLRLNVFSDLSLAGSSLNLTASGIADTDSNVTNGILGSRARITVGSAGNYDWATPVISGTENWAITALPAGSYTTALSGAATNANVSLTDSSIATSASAAQTVNTLKLSNTSGSLQTLDITAANTLSLSAGGLLVTGTNPIAINNGSLRSTSGTPIDLIVHQYNSGGLTINSVISNGTNSNSLTKTGDGVLTLAATNTYSGTTFINGGVLSIGANANLGTLATGSVTVTSSLSSSTVTLASATLPAGFQVGSGLLGQTVTSISGTTVVLTGNANTALAGAAATYTTGGGLNLNNGTLSATGTFSLSETLAGTRDRGITLNGVGGTFEVTGANVLTSPGSFSGPGGLTKTGTGTLVMGNGTNAYSGPTNVVNGTLRFAVTANPTRSDVTVGALGTLEQAGGSSFIGSLSGAGVVTNTGAAATLTIGSTHLDTTFSGQLTNAANALSIDKMGAGTLTLTGANNNYTGSTTVSGGALVLSGSGALPTATALNVSSAAASFDASGITAPSVAVRTLASALGSTVTLGSKELSLAPSEGTVSVTSSSTGSPTVTVASVPTYLTVGSALLGRTVSAISGTTITLAGGNAGQTITSATNVPVIFGTAGTTAAGVISGVGASLTKGGTGTLTLRGANTYDGITTINTGTIVAASNNALGLSSTNGGGNVVINSNGSNITGGQLNIGSTLGGVTLTKNIIIQGTGDGGPSFNSVVNGAGGVTSTLDGTITLTGTNSYRVGSSDANTLFNVGLITRSTASGGSLILSPSGNSTISINTAIDNNGGGVTVHGGGGTAILSASNNDIGAVLVQNNSNLRITASDALALNQNLTLGQGALANGATVAGNDIATFTVDATNQTINSLLGFANAGTSPNNASATGNRLITSTTAGAKLLTVGNGNGSGGFDGVISNGTGGGTLAFSKVGTGTQSFLGTAANTYTGDTTVNGGVLALGKTAGVAAITGNLIIGNGAGGLDIVRLDNNNQIADGSSVSFNGSGADAGILRLNSFNETIAGISSTGGAGIIENGGATGSVFTTNFNSGIQTFSGLIQDGAGAGALSLTKSGGGTQIISGANAFSGATVIDGGVLLANNASGSALGISNVSVNGASSIFGGTGEITGGVTLNGGILSPGASIESLTVGSVGGTGSLLIEYDSTAQTIDVLNVTGAFDLTNITLSLADLGNGSLDTNTGYVFATYTPLSLVGNFALVNGLPTGFTLDYAFGGNNIAIVAVPEPNTLALLTVAIVGGGLYRRSRNAKKAAAKS